MTNKEIAILFLKTVGMGAVDKGFSAFVSADFIHHNQYFKGDRQSLIDAMKQDHQNNPNRAIRPQQVLADKDKIVVHSLVEKVDMQIAVVHIFRFSEDKIVELWDLGQVIEKNSPNQHGLF